jgi:hypothetical protein
MMRMDTLVERRAMLVIRDMGPPATPASPARLAGDRVAHVPTLAARRARMAVGAGTRDGRRRSR